MWPIIALLYSPFEGLKEFIRFRDRINNLVTRSISTASFHNAASFLALLHLAQSCQFRSRPVGQ